MKPKSRKLCEVPECMRRRIYLYRGRVRADRHHRLCLMHYRSYLAKMWSRIQKERDDSKAQSNAPRATGLAIPLRYAMATGLAG